MDNCLLQFDCKYVVRLSNEYLKWIIAQFPYQFFLFLILSFLSLHLLRSFHPEFQCSGTRKASWQHSENGWSYSWSPDVCDYPLGSNANHQEKVSFCFASILTLLASSKRRINKDETFFMCDRGQQLMPVYITLTLRVVGPEEIPVLGDPATKECFLLQRDNDN